MEQQKRDKGSHKEFSRWMVNEIEDFFPEIKSEDPLKGLSHLLDKNPIISIPYYQRKKLIVVKSRPAIKVQHGPNFKVEKYWKQFSSQLNEKMIRFLDLQDIIMLMYTCKYFKETLDQESMWRILQGQEFPALGLGMLRDDMKDRVSEKLYYKYLYLTTISGIPYHTGYFKTYGSPDVAELSEFIVDFLCPKKEVIKNYVGEILVRNQCKTFDLKLSWLKEKNEICLWNGNSSLEFKTREVGNEEVETVHKFYPCFIKRYSIIDEDEAIIKIFFLEDKYLVVKLQKKEGERVLSTRFRILNLEEELYSIAKGLEPAIPIDYSFMGRKVDGNNLVDIKTNEFGVDFGIDQENGCDIQIKLLSGDRAVFYTENSVKPTMIFWDLKEKKKIDVVCLDLEKSLNTIIISKKSTTETDRIKLILLDEDMNVYCGLLSEKDGFLLNNKIILPSPAEEKKEEEIEIEMSQEDIDKLKELEAKYYLNLGKKTRDHYRTGPRGRYHSYPASNDSSYSIPKQSKPLDPQFREKTRRYYHEVWNKTNEEWLIVRGKNNFHFINLDKGKIQEFSIDNQIGFLTSRNWAVYEDNLLITNSEQIFYFQINFEYHSLNFRFSRGTHNLSVGDVGIQWTVIDPCFTVLIFTHICRIGFAANVTIIVVSTQEFLYNQDPAFNLISFKVQAEQFLRAGYRLENKDRDLDIKFENSKVLLNTEIASFYFDMNLSAQPYNKVYLNGWMSNKSINMIRGVGSVVTQAKSQVEVQEEETKPSKQKMVNYMKLGGNPNTMNAKEKNNGWKKGGKSQAKKEEDKENRVLKGKGDKYQKNIRQGQRSDKVN